MRLDNLTHSLGTLEDKINEDHSNRSLVNQLTFDSVLMSASAVSSREIAIKSLPVASFEVRNSFVFELCL